MGATLTPARRYGPAGVHRPPAHPEPIAYAELCTPADCYAAAAAIKLIAAALAAAEDDHATD